MAEYETTLGNQTLLLSRTQETNLVQHQTTPNKQTTQPHAPDYDAGSEPLNNNPVQNSGEEDPLGEQWDNIPSSDGIQPDEPSHHQAPTSQQWNRHQKNVRASLKIVSLNIKGYGQTGQGLKWLHVNQLVREQRIGVLAIQETHMKRTDGRKPKTCSTNAYKYLHLQTLLTQPKRLELC